jgi:3-oxoacyl-[acyl-carrier-protein] synthase-3
MGKPGDQAEAGQQYEQRLLTDGPKVLRTGVALATATWQGFLRTMNWQLADVDRVITHQVGRSNRESLLAALSLNQDQDFPTYAQLGNMGSVALPLSMALADQERVLRRGQRVGLLGIGSGLNCIMMGVEW